MSLSCLRLRLLMLFGIAWFGYMLVAGARHVALGRLPDYSPERLLAAAGVGLVLVVLLVFMVGGLTGRVVLDDDGVHLMWFTRRRSFGWDEIDDITLSMSGRFWVSYLHTSSGTHRISVLSCPILFSLRFSNHDFSEAPPFTPGSLRRPYQRLREEWLRRRSAAPA